MAIFVSADDEHKRRADCGNTIVAVGADEAATRVGAEALIDEPDGLAAFRAVQLGEGSPAFLAEGHTPVGARGQAVWPGLTRGGSLSAT